MCWLSWLNGGVPEASAPRVGVDPQPPPLAWLNGGVPEASAPRVGADPQPPPFNIFSPLKQQNPFSPLHAFTIYY